MGLFFSDTNIWLYNELCNREMKIDLNTIRKIIKYGNLWTFLGIVNAIYIR